VLVRKVYYKQHILFLTLGYKVNQCDICLIFLVFILFNCQKHNVNVYVDMWKIEVIHAIFHLGKAY